jgi:membrane-associated protein
MEFLEISSIISFLAHWGYFGVFAGIILGGEILLLTAGFLVTLGYFKIFWVIIIATVAVVIHDVFWYLLGLMGRKVTFFKKIGKKLFSEKKLKKVENQLKIHANKTILFIRWIYGFRAIILLMTGGIRMKFLNFIFINLLGSLIWATVSTLIGYFFGHSILFLKVYIKNMYLFGIMVTSLVFLILFLISYIKNKLIKKGKLNNLV